MKKIILFSTLSLIAFQARAQILVQEMSGDSSRYIELHEVRLHAKQKTTQQSLLHFFRTNNASSLEDILVRLPEISFIRRGPYGMEPSIRTFTGGQMNTLIDGMRMYGACTDKMDPPTIYIEPSNLENLLVHTTQNGFLSGSSIGGTVNMELAEPDYRQAHPLSGSISSGYQSAAKSFYESIRLNYATGKWAVLASGTYRKSDDYRSGGGEIIDYSQIEKINYSLSAKYRYNEYTYLKADFLGDDGWNIGYPALPMDVGYAAARIGSIGIEYDHRNKSLYRWSAKFYANRVKHFMDDTQRPDVPIHMDMPGISKTIGAYADGDLKISPRQNLMLRADLSSSYLFASMTMYQDGQLPMYMLTWPDHKKYQSGLSAAWIFYIDSLWSLRLNARMDLINYRLESEEAKEEVSILGYPSADRNDFLKNLSAQISRKIHPAIKTSFGISYTERVPTGSELYGFYLFNSQDNYDYIGKPDLKNETSLQLEGTVVYNKGPNRILVTGFYNRIQNYITGIVDSSLSSMTIGASGVKSYFNLPHATLSGLEISAVLAPAKYWQLISTLRYTYGITNKGQALPMIPPLKNIGSLRFEPGRFSAQMEYEASGQQVRINENAGEDKTAGYFLVHARLGYKFEIFKSLIGLQFGVENVFDRLYHEHLDWGNIPRPGRNLYFQIKISF